jgi:pyruvate/2-oxoglutarate/acetoin dehydrogenase E1 component
MFGDFTTLIADQLINHIAKFSGMYNGQAQAPVVIRTPMGGSSGDMALPTQPNFGKAFFLGVPGLTVLAPFNLLGEDPPGRTLVSCSIRRSSSGDSPTFFVENKLQYLLKLHSDAGRPV